MYVCIYVCICVCMYLNFPIVLKNNITAMLYVVYVEYCDISPYSTQTQRGPAVYACMYVVCEEGVSLPVPKRVRPVRCNARACTNMCFSYIILYIPVQIVQGDFNASPSKNITIFI